MFSTVRAFVSAWVGAVALFGMPGFLSPQEPAPGLKDLVPEIRKGVDRHYAHLESLYKHLHANPELSFQEEKTAARLAKEMREIGFTVTEKFGGHGLVCVLKNGDGPVVMVRTDMDALPIVE